MVVGAVVYVLGMTLIGSIVCLVGLILLLAT